MNIADKQTIIINKQVFLTYNGVLVCKINNNNNNIFIIIKPGINYLVFDIIWLSIKYMQ